MKISKSWRGYNTLTLKYVPERSVIYARVSDASQNKGAQLKLLEKHFPDLFDSDSIIIPDEMKGNSSVVERFAGIPKKSFVCSSHPDRVTKIDDCREVLRMVKFFRKKKIKLTFPEIKNLVMVAENFFSDPTPEKFQIMVSARMMAHSNPRAESNTLTKEQRRVIMEIYERLYEECDKNLEWDADHLFWMLYAHMGYAVNQALRETNAKAREKSDNSFATKAPQIKLLDALEYYLKIYPDRPWKEIARMLSKNRGLTTEKGTQYKVSYLSRVKNEHLEKYEALNPEIEKVWSWIQKPEVESKRKKVQPKNPKIKVGMEEAGFDSLYITQNKTLKRLLKGKSVILQDRSGGGKSEIPIIYNFITGKPVVAIIPTLALAKNSRDRLLEHFPKDEVAVYNSKTHARNPKTLSLLRQRAIRFLLTTPEQMSKKELIDAIRKNGSGLLFFDECHNISFSGLTYRPKYNIREIKKIVDKLGDFTLLFASATVDESSYTDIIDTVDDYEYISGPLSRPNLKLFIWRFENLGQKLSGAHKLITNLRGEELEKGILYFNTVGGLLRAKKELEELGHPCRAYFGKEKEGWDWDTKKKNMEEFANYRRMLMLATTSFGEGLDFEDVGFVICMDMPGSIEELYQWLGRAGRDGGNSPVFLFDDPQGRASRKFLFESSQNNDVSKKFQRERYGELTDFMEKHRKPSMKDLAGEI